MPPVFSAINNLTPKEPDGYSGTRRFVFGWRGNLAAPPPGHPALAWPFSAAGGNHGIPNTYLDAMAPAAVWRGTGQFLSMRKTLKRAVLVFAGILAVFLLLWLWNTLALVREQASPDEYQLGTIYTGATVEFSAKFLVSSGQHPVDKMFDAIVKRLPKAWAPTLAKVHPKNFRHPSGPVELAELRPVAYSSSFLRVSKLTPDQRKEWYKGVPFVIAEMALDTTHPGKFAGKVRVTMGRRTAVLPVSVTILPRPAKLPRLLIASTPYEAYTTSTGANFHAVTKVLSFLPLSADYRRQMPTNLAPYQVVFLADAALVGLNNDDIERLRAFIDSGGRLVFACDAFMSGSVPSANRILTNYGLQMLDRDYGQVGELITVTNFNSDPLVRGVARLVFHRPALINVAAESRAKAVALAPEGQGAFVAVSRLTNGGEVAALSSSLWWYWVHQFSTNSDNARLMQNLFNPPTTDNQTTK